MAPAWLPFGSLSGADLWLPAIPRTKSKNPLGSVGELRGLRLSGLFLGVHDIRQFPTAFTTPAWKSYGNRGESLVIFWGDFLLVFLGGVVASLRPPVTTAFPHLLAWKRLLKTTYTVPGELRPPE